MSDMPKDLRRARAQGNDLKEQIIALIEKHPARENGLLFLLPWLNSD